MVRAANPTAEDFDIRYYVSEPDGADSRVMTEGERLRFYNRARCECGQPVRTKIALKPGAEPYDNTTLFQALVGIYCDTAEENPVGQFRRCGQLFSGTAPSLQNTVTVDFHPVFLSDGLDLTSETRDVSDSRTIPAGTCNYEGESRVWICEQTNGIVGCQTDEFIVGDDPSTSPALRHDFLPPLILPTAIEVTAADGGAQLHWASQVGDIAGFRVLCQRSDNGAPVEGLDFEPPEITDTPDGTNYFTTQDLCGGEPFLGFTGVGGPAGSCGDGHVDAGEACDDGEDNRDDGLCTSSCQLAVSAGMQALSWDHVCSDVIRFNEKSVDIHGLENGVEYQLVLVAYDAAGNPRAAPQVLRVTPDAGLEPLPGAVDEGCDCRSTGGGSSLALLLLTGLGLRRRRRTRDAT